MSKKTLLNSKDIEIILHRLACQLIENHNDFSNTVLIGLQPRGSYLANRLSDLLKNKYQVKGVQLGLLDITFYRDDFRRRDAPLEANTTHVDFIIENKNVVIIDDVLFSGRTIRAALDALGEIGRPRTVQLAALVDRGHRELPIKADFVGKNLPTAKAQTVRVLLGEIDGRDEVSIEGESN